MAENFKIGIMCDSMLLQLWEYASLERIKNSGYGDISLIIRNPSGKSRKNHQESTPGYSVVQFHQKLDALIFNKKNNYSKKKSISNLAKNVPVLVPEQIEDGNNVSFNKTDLSEIKKYNLDIILKFGFRSLKGEILHIPRYGIWSFPMSENNNPLKITGGYMEMINKEPVTDSMVTILTEVPENNTIISFSRESTCSYSINLTRNKIHWRSSLFVPRVLAGLHKYGEDYLKDLLKKHELEKENLSSQFQMPAVSTAILNLFSHFTLAFRKVVKKIFYTDAFKWVLFYNTNKCNARDAFQSNFNDFKKLLPPKGKFWADPFVVAKNGNYYVFVEEFIYRTNRGHISVLKLDQTGQLLNNQMIINKPYHMSYPFIIEQDNTYYMIPESSENGTIDLYKCTRFPDKWEYARNIMKNLKAVDTTLFFYNNKWWLFTVIDETKGISGCETELFLYYSDSVFSDTWKSHPLNPVVADARIARPAGNIFILDNKIYRPSQDCSVRYGNALNLNEIVSLSETEYLEVPVFRREPAWDKKLRGMHTYNFDNGFSIIDAYSYHRRGSF